MVHTSFTLEVVARASYLLEVSGRRPEVHFRLGVGQSPREGILRLRPPAAIASNARVPKEGKRGGWGQNPSHPICSSCGNPRLRAISLPSRLDENNERYASIMSSQSKAKRPFVRPSPLRARKPRPARCDKKKNKKPPPSRPPQSPPPCHRSRSCLLHHYFTFSCIVPLCPII